MEDAGGIAEVFPEYPVIREEIRSKSHEDAGSLFEEMLLQAIFLRRVETDPGFRWNICIRISSDEALSEMLRRTIMSGASGAEESPAEGLLRLRRMEENPDAICCLFAEETSFPLHYWETKRAGFLYRTISYQTALQTQPPERSALLHPMDQAILTSFIQEAGTGADTAHQGGVEGSVRIKETITAVACHYFLALSYEERMRIINRRYPDNGWDELIKGFMIFEPSTGALLAGARYCASMHLIEAARSLYSLACSHAEDPDIRQLSYREMGLLSRNIGDYERTFSEFTSAIEAARGKAENESPSLHDELIYLCEAAEKLGLSEEGETIFDRLISIARNLEGGERTRLLMQVATSCRRSGCFDREYELIEDLIGEEECDDLVLARLDTLNRAMRRDATLDSGLLADLEAGAEADYTILRGTLAFGAFQFDDALTWFTRSVQLQNSPTNRLWRGRALWYADKPSIDISSEKGDLLETRIISGLLRGEKYSGAGSLIAGGSEEEAYDGILVLLEWAAGRGDILEAIEALTGESEALPLTQEEKVRILKRTAKVLSECGIPDAIPLFRRALKLTTAKEARAEILSEIGYWHETNAQPKKAAEAYKRSIEQYQEFPGAWAGLARSHAKQGEYDAAIEAINTAIRYQPGREEYRMIRDLVQERIGTDGLERDLQQKIDQLDRRLFDWKDTLPASLAERYRALIRFEAGRGGETGDLLGEPVRIPAEEVLAIRNNVIRNAFQHGTNTGE